jgi:hypothetical protein
MGRKYSMTLMCMLLPVAVNMARVMAVTRRVEVLARKAIMDQKWESIFKSSEHGMKVLYDPDVYAVTCGSEHCEGDGCDEEGGGAGQKGYHGPEVGVLLQEQ